jgi:hypothetical protein
LTAVGADQVRAQAAAGKTAVLVEASDGSRAERDKMVAAARGARVVEVFTRRELGPAVGRDEAVHIGLAAGGLTETFATDAARYEGVRQKHEAPVRRA